MIICLSRVRTGMMALCTVMTLVGRLFLFPDTTYFCISTQNRLGKRSEDFGCYFQLFPSVRAINENLEHQSRFKSA